MSTQQNIIETTGGNSGINRRNLRLIAYQTRKKSKERRKERNKENKKIERERIEKEREDNPKEVP